MTRHVRQIGLAILLGLAVSATDGVAATSQRNVTGYDKLGFDYTKSTEPANLDRQLQKFIYAHWQQHRRAFVVIRIIALADPHRADITKLLFVEPAKDGSWCVRGEVEADVSPLRWVPASQRTPPKHVTTQFEAVSVDWVFEHDRKSLVLKDRSGKAVDTL
jgi:hypothetical protein